eukprot:4772360-Prymnesium_polylepis.1
MKTTVSPSAIADPLTIRDVRVSDRIVLGARVTSGGGKGGEGGGHGEGGSDGGGARGGGGEDGGAGGGLSKQLSDTRAIAASPHVGAPPRIALVAALAPQGRVCAVLECESPDGGAVQMVVPRDGLDAVRARARASVIREAKQ